MPNAINASRTGSMETDGAAATAAANDAAFVSGSSQQSLLVDLFSASSSSTLGEDLGTSTIAIFVLFGASTFAAVGMFSKTWLLEDYRGACLFVLLYSICAFDVSMNTIDRGVRSLVVRCALNISIQFSLLNSTDCSSLHSSVNFPSYYWFSIAINVATDLTKQLQLQPYRSIAPLDLSFVSLFTFFYNLSILGVILFGVFIMERYPPFHHEFRTEFDADYMAFVLILVIIVAWYTVERNDGKQIIKKRQLPGVALAQNGAVAATSSGTVEGRRKGGVTFHSDATVTSVAASRGSVRSHTSAASSKSGVSAASSTGSAEIMDMQQGGDGGDNNNNGHYQSMLRHRNSKGVDSDTLGGADASSIKSEEHKSMLAAHGFSKSHLEQNIHVQSVLEMVGATGGAVRGSSQSVASLSIQSMDKNLEDILLDDETVKTVGPSDNSKNKRLLAVEPVNDVLNYSQSLEWKGLMSTAFIVYEVCNAGSYVPYASKGEEPLDESLVGIISASSSGVNTYYNLARLSVTCYIFITGFNHTIYFYAKRDYSLVRVLRILFRINFTVIFLCLMLGNRWILYNICPLHSYFFLLVYATMSLKRNVNYTKYGLRIKILCLGLFVFAVWDLGLGLFTLTNRPFFARGPEGLKGAPFGPLWEFYYRTHLHHFSAVLGMCYAINYPIVSLLQRKLEALSMTTEFVSKGVTVVALLVAFGLWAVGPLDATKYAFNATHPYFAFIPILCYLYMRNINATLREHSVGLFKNIGRFSLEIYLLHHHVFLSNDGSSVTVLIPGYPKCNAMLLGFLLINVAKILKTTTEIVTSMLLPANDEAKSVRNVVVFGAAILITHGITLILRAMGILNLNTIATSIIILGVFLYQAIMDTTWNSYRRLHGKGLKVRGTAANESMTAKASPFIIGTLVVFLLGITLNIASLLGAKSGVVPLDIDCEPLANDGAWVDIDACSPFERGISAREYGVGGFYESISLCGEESISQWAWNHNSDSSACHFHHRSKLELRKKLSGKKVVFVGDTMLREMFHSVCRSLGKKNCGEFDSLAPAHADTKITVGETELEYRWAPLAVDEEKKLKEYRTDSEVKGKPDIILVGGGAWDRLHVYATDEDQESHKQAVKKLASEINEMRTESIPTIWMTPTTVNTQALNNEEKRIQMSEEGMQEMRKIYADLGVEAASAFVLDGPSFTYSRAGESYDGIHYPHEVYDVGTQILANAMDWLLPFDDVENGAGPEYDPLPLGSMSNPFLGMMILCFIAIGLFFFDGYVGFSYLSSAFVRVDSTFDSSSAYSLMPNDVFEEAFRPLHQRFRLPDLVRSKETRLTCGAHEESTGDEDQLEMTSLLDSVASPTSGGGSTTSRRQQGNRVSSSLHSNSVDQDTSERA